MLRFSYSISETGFDWDDVTEWYAALLKQQRRIAEDFDRDIDELYYQQIALHFECELREEVLTAKEVDMRIPIMVYARTLEDHALRTMERFGADPKLSNVSKELDMARLHEILDPVLRKAYEAFNTTLDSQLVEFENMEKKTKVTMEFDARASRIKRDMQKACALAVRVVPDGKHAAARSMIEYSLWKGEEAQKQHLLESLTLEEKKRKLLDKIETYGDDFCGKSFPCDIREDDKPMVAVDMKGLSKIFWM